MNFKSVLQAFSSVLQSNTTTPPPIPTAPTQNRTSLPISEAILMDLDLLDQVQNHAIAPQSASTTPSPIPAAPIQQNSMPLPLEAQYPSREALFEAIRAWAKPHGYAFTTGKSKKSESGRIKVYYAYDRCRPIPSNIARIRHTQSRGIGCLFSVLACELPEQQG